MDTENSRIAIEREKCRGKAYVGAIIGGIVGLTFLIRWIVNTYTDIKIL